MNATLIFVLFLLLIVLVFGSAAVASMSAAPWLPVRKKDYKRIVAAFASRTGTCIDLGAGDARIVSLLASQTSMQCIGYEMSALPYVAAWIRLRFAPPKNKGTIEFKNFYSVPFQDVKNIFCFLTPMAMKKLKVKFEKECSPGTRIVSYSFSIPGWTPTRIDRDGTGIPVHIYDR